MIQLAVFDIDGTLIPPEKGELAPETVAALRHLQSKGIRTAIASGRLMYFLPPELLELGFDYYILSNGCCVADSRGVTLHQRTIDAATLEALLGEMIRRGHPIDLRYPEGNTDGNPNCSVQQRMRAFWAGKKFVGKAPKAMLERITPKPGALPISASGYIPEEELPEFEAMFPQLEFLSVFESPLCDIIPTGISKATGIATVCGLTGISMEQVIAFGDDRNDLEMVAAAGIGVAMGNAIRAIKAEADHITDTSVNLGVVKALRHFGLLDEMSEHITT